MRDAVIFLMLQMRKLGADHMAIWPGSYPGRLRAHALSWPIATALETQVLVTEIKSASLL